MRILVLNGSPKRDVSDTMHITHTLIEGMRDAAEQADCYFRDLWLVAFSFATLIVTDDSPYTDEQMSAIFTEFSLAICKAYKEIPGLHRGDFDRDTIFRQLTSGGGADGS